MARRENGMGSISKRKDGTWTGRIDIGTQPNGKRKMKAVYGKTEAEVKRKLKEVRNAITKGEFKQDIKAVTVKSYMDNWLRNYKRQEVKPSTYDTIEATCNNLIYPRIGNFQFSAVKSSDIQNMINDLTDRGYSYSSIRKVYNYTKVEVVYNFEAEGASVGNRADTYGKTTHTFINCLGKNTCDETYFIQIEIYRADWTSNFNFDMGGDGTEHPFEFKSLVDKCNGDNKFWDFKVYKTA